MLLTRFIWQTVLKPLSGTNAKNGAITPSLTPTIHTIHARCYKASECGEGWGGGVQTGKAPGGGGGGVGGGGGWRPMMVPRGDLALVLGILWMSLVGEPSNNLRRQGAGLLVVVLWLWD
jgi:hypothetical protein